MNISTFWKGVRQTEDIFWPGISFKLGNGESTSFWLDRWCTTIPLASLFLDIYRGVINKFIVVGDHFRHGNWNVQSNNILTTLPDVHNLQHAKDRPQWRWNTTSTFSVNFVYWFINDEGLWMRHAKTIWSVRCPLKIRVFLWLIEKNVLLTWDNLQRRGWVGPSICTLCGNEEETIEHITLRCDSVRSLWLLCTDYSPAPSPHNANVTSTWEHDYVSRHRGPNPHTLIAPMVWNV